MFDERGEFFFTYGYRYAREKLAEVVRETRTDFVERDGTLEKFFERGGFAAGNTTGNDEVEVAQVGSNVVSKTVRGNPAAEMHADCGELFFRDIAGRLNPNAGFSGDAIRSDAEIRRGTDHGFLEGANVPVDIAADAIEIEDRITDELAGAVIGNITAAIGFSKLDSFLAKNMFGGEEIFLAGVAAEGEDVRVLAEEKDVFNPSGFAGGDNALLEFVGCIPGADSEIADEERLGHLNRISDIRNQISANRNHITYCSLLFDP